MDSLPVTLIVKAPNQQIEDQKIKCEPSWTINKLKQHISEVYPSKPPKEEQKLIYSGQLLSDNTVLKDVLRVYEGQEMHTLHLVCTNKRDLEAKPSSSSSSAPPAPSPTDTAPAQELHAAYVNHPPSPHYQGVPNNPNQFVEQMALMQQAYIQYMNQYMQLATNNAYGGPPRAPAPLNVENVAAEAPVNNQANNPGVGAGGEALDVGGALAERDWLDHFYLVTRMLVFFSVIYFYSSLVRFAFVLFLGLAVYLYQVGFFRNLHHHHNNNNTTNTDTTTPLEEQPPSRLTVLWTFFTTFFASLLPEIPNAPV